jgi:hypothetical protein
MSRLIRCASCQGFLPPQEGTCPHCGTEQPAPSQSVWGSRLGLGLLACMGGSAFAVTLMACYGCPPSACGGFDLGPPGKDLGPSPCQRADGSPQDAGIWDGGCGLDR